MCWVGQCRGWISVEDGSGVGHVWVEWVRVGWFVQGGMGHGEVG